MIEVMFLKLCRDARGRGVPARWYARATNRNSEGGMVRDSAKRPLKRHGDGFVVLLQLRYK